MLLSIYKRSINNLAMKLTYNNVTIDFFEKNTSKPILLSVSGGLDSASLFYVMCKHRPDLEIVPFTCNDLSCPFDVFSAIDVINWIRDEFPKQKIYETEEHKFDHNDPYWLDVAKEKWESEKISMTNGELVGRTGKLTGLAKAFQMEEIHKLLWQKYPGSVMCTGYTSNPPVEEQRKYGFYDISERRRDPPSYKNQWSGKTYHPFCNVDKKFVADIFFQNNLMDSLYPLTASCIGSRDDTNNYTQECGKCYWCYEKEWAFKK